MNAPAEAVRRVRRTAAVSAAFLSCVGLVAAPVAVAEGPVDNVRNAVLNVRNTDSLCNELQFSGELEGYAQEWVGTARALDTLNTPTFPGAPYNGQTRQWIASGDPTAEAIGELINVARADIQTCGFYQYGVGMSRDDVIDKSFVAVILGKPNVPAPEPAPPVNNLPPAQEPAPEPEPEPEPVQPTATVISDVDVYDVPGGEGTVVGILRGTSVVDLLTCQADQWCQVSGAAVPGGTGWVWGEFLQR